MIQIEPSVPATNTLHTFRFSTDSQCLYRGIAFAILFAQVAFVMAKRPAEDADCEEAALKGGDRPVKADNSEEMDFEDDFEDEYESEDEIFEAGADGRPDGQREAEEGRGTWILP